MIAEEDQRFAKVGSWTARLLQLVKIWYRHFSRPPS